MAKSSPVWRKRLAEVSHFRKEHNAAHLCLFIWIINRTIHPEAKYGWYWGFMYGPGCLHMWHCADVVGLAMLFTPVFIYSDTGLWHSLLSFFQVVEVLPNTFYLHVLSLQCYSCSVCLVFACTGSRPCWLLDVILYLAEKECMNAFGIPMSMTAMQRPQSHRHLLEEPGWDSSLFLCTCVMHVFSVSKRTDASFSLLSSLVIYGSLLCRM